MHSSHPSPTASGSPLMLVQAGEVIKKCCGAWVRSWPLATKTSVRLLGESVSAGHSNLSRPAEQGARRASLLRSFSKPLIIRCGPTFLLVSEQTNALRISEQTNAHESASMREAFWGRALEMPERRLRLPTP